VTVNAGTRLWHPQRPLDLHATLGSLRRGSGDPAYRVTPDGAIWRTALTPEGPGTLRLARPPSGAVAASAWGPGAGWLLETVPTLLGEDDDPTGFVPDTRLLRDLVARNRGWRVPRTGLVFEALAAAIIEQKVTGMEARRAWRYLLGRFGTPAPGPAPQGMRVPPAARDWRLIPSWEWRRAGVDGKRSAAVLAAARVAARLEETVALPHAEAERRLRTVPGVGIWTAAEVRQRAHGDPDAVSVGDYHLAKQVGWAFTGQPVDDERMLELLAPYAGHRYRVIRHLELGHVRPPRRGPRLAPHPLAAQSRSA
jgi:3-methyladenine DNA glycosylase/8-oxoguanine DNA glycosylase